MTVIDFSGSNLLNGLFSYWKRNSENLDELVEIAANSYVSDATKPSNLLDQTESAWHSSTNDEHWVSFHLLKHKLALSRYSLWQYSSNERIIKSWIIKGSLDNDTYYEIDVRNEPDGICVVESTHSFPASSLPFSFFRLIKIEYFLGL